MTVIGVVAMIGFGLSAYASNNKEISNTEIPIGGNSRVLLQRMITVNSSSSISQSYTETEIIDDSSEGGVYPPDLFTDSEIRNGGFLLYLLGMLYTFAALAIVCDDYFVPSLEVISETLNLSDDVAGATFMAAGGSAPELFTSMLGEFIARSNVGFGTIVGSAVFNVMFVIGACALATMSIFPEGLPLTWWPLFRDSSFYAFDLALLTWFYSDSKIEGWEAGVLLLMYFVYVGFMTQSEKFQKYAESCVGSSKGNKQPSFANMDLSVNVDTCELTEVLSPTVQSSTQPQPIETLRESTCSSSSSKSDEEDDDEAWHPTAIPEECSDKIKFAIFFPLNFIFWLTIPNCNREEKKKYFVMAFLLSIFWIGVFSYLMVWWADSTGRALNIPTEVMGYTLLAAGTSVPDLITSVLVARLGRGDMAVSSSIGSNIFDITFGLPLPWFIRCCINKFEKPLYHESNSLGSSVAMLFLMLISVIVSIACLGWRLHKKLGVICVVLYIIFVIVSLLLEYKTIEFL